VGLGLILALLLNRPDAAIDSNTPDRLKELFLDGGYGLNTPLVLIIGSRRITISSPYAVADTLTAEMCRRTILGNRVISKRVSAQVVDGIKSIAQLIRYKRRFESHAAELKKRTPNIRRKLIKRRGALSRWPSMGYLGEVIDFYKGPANLVSPEVELEDIEGMMSTLTHISELGLSK